jgi:hypothetical protein
MQNRQATFVSTAIDMVGSIADGEAIIISLPDRDVVADAVALHVNALISQVGDYGARSSPH